MEHTKAKGESFLRGTCSVAPQWAKKSFINAVVQKVDFSYPVLWQNTAFGHLPCENKKFSTMQKGQTTPTPARAEALRR